MRIWRSQGCMTRARTRALDAHLRAIRATGARNARSRPGSYAWPRLRREAEQAFALGNDVLTTINQLRQRHLLDHATVPSIRTMRRWFSQCRWLRILADGSAGAGRLTAPGITASRARRGARTGRPAGSARGSAGSAAAGRSGRARAARRARSRAPPGPARASSGASGSGMGRSRGRCACASRRAAARSTRRGRPGRASWTSRSPHSSRSSRRSACSIVSPGSTPPPGSSQ